MIRPSQPFIVVFVCSAIAPAVALGQTGLSPHDVAKLRRVTDAAISPDGSEIAYLVSVPRDPFEQSDGRAYSELHVTTRDGNSRPFVTGEVNVSRVDWTPDGEISFLTKRGDDKGTSLYVISPTGGEARRVLTHETAISSYSWGPGGKVAFLAREPESKELKDLKEKGFTQQIYEEDTQPVRVWIGDTRGPDEPKMLDLTGSASELHWSPAGKSIAVALAPTPLVDDHYMRRLVHVVEATTGKLKARLHHPAKLGGVAWSPDDRHLITISGEDINDPNAGRLFLWNADGEKIHELVPNFRGNFTSLAWRDKDSVIAIAAEGVWTSVSTIQISDGTRTELVGSGGPILSKLVLADNGLGAAIGDAADHPAEVFVFQDSQSAPKRVTHHNSWLNERRLAKQQVVKHKARDGLELEGILIHPLQRNGDERVPLILAVHGGPEAHISAGWTTYYSRPGQMAAARNMAVFYPNYRGSTGRGVEFSKLGQEDAAGKEFDDLVDAVDHLVEIGLADKKRVGITGGSYGGYASAWGATYYTKRFAASVMFVGISNNISKTGTTDIPYEMFHVHHRKWLWDDWEYFTKRSPIYYAEQSRTPTLILHGKDDPRVHPGQSMELYRHLKVLGKTPVRLVLYPGEGHGNLRAASRLDYSLRMLRWMEHYLKGPGGEMPHQPLNYESPSDP